MRRKCERLSKLSRLKLQLNKEEAAKVAGENNLQEGEAFLAEKAKSEDVVVLESGLHYKIIEEGVR